MKPSFSHIEKNNQENESNINELKIYLDDEFHSNFSVKFDKF